MDDLRPILSYEDVCTDSSCASIQDSSFFSLDRTTRKKKKHRKGKPACGSNDDDYEEPESFQSIAFPVATSLSNPLLGPQSGEEFLFLVQEERKTLPSIVTVDSCASSLLTMDQLLAMGFSFTAAHGAPSDSVNKFI